MASFLRKESFALAVTKQSIFSRCRHASQGTFSRKCLRESKITTLTNSSWRVSSTKIVFRSFSTRPWSCRQQSPWTCLTQCCCNLWCSIAWWIGRTQMRSSSSSELSQSSSGTWHISSSHNLRSSLPRTTLRHLSSSRLVSRSWRPCCNRWLLPTPTTRLSFSRQFYAWSTASLTISRSVQIM